MVSCDGLRIGWPLHKYDGLRLLHDLYSYSLQTTLYIRTLYIITIQQEGLHSWCRLAACWATLTQYKIASVLCPKSILRGEERLDDPLTQQAQQAG